MSTSAMPRKSRVSPPTCQGSFQAVVNQYPLVVSLLSASLTLRPELAPTPRQWIWKVIAEGKVGRKRASIGLFFDRDLPLGTHDLVASEYIKVVYHQTPNSQNIIYHSGHIQAGQLTLLEADLSAQRLRGEFGFSISALDFAVTEGEFDLHCLPT